MQIDKKYIVLKTTKKVNSSKPTSDLLSIRNVLERTYRKKTSRDMESSLTRSENIFLGTLGMLITFIIDVKVKRKRFGRTIRYMFKSLAYSLR